MGREADTSHEQWPLSQTMRELEVRNAEVGGILFSTVGKGNERAFLFPTYVTRQEGNVTVNEFLVVTLARMKTIQVHSVGSGISAEDISRSIIRAEDAGGYKVKWGSGDILDFQTNEQRFRVGEYKTRLGVAFFENSGEVWNCKLVDINEAQIKEMLVANIKRVEATRSITQEVSVVLNKAS